MDYNGGGSGGSNKGTNNPEYLAQVEERIDAFLAAHPYLSREEVPAEMVTASVRASIPTSRSAVPKFRSAASPEPAACPKPR